MFFALRVNGWQCTSVAATRQETEAPRAAPRDKRLGGVGAARTFAAVWSASGEERLEVLAHTDDADDLVFTILSHGVPYDT